MTDQPYPTGALPTPPEKLALGWPITLALAAAPTAAPAKFHHPGCGPTLNQSPFGACVGYGMTSAHAAQELADEGRMLIPGVLDPLHLYAASKGLPWPPPPDAPINPIGWDPTPGAWPAQVLAYAKAHGIPTKDGSAPRKIGPYYLMGEPNGSLSFLEVYQQTLLQLGPAIFSMLWTSNWFATLAGGYMPAPNFQYSPSGHLVEACGYQVGCPVNFPGCTWDAICHQSWGSGWGKDPEFKDHFRIHSPHLSQVGKEAWKWTDIRGDAPTPPAPGGTMTLPIYDAAPKHQLVDLAVGAKLYSAADGKTPFVPPEVKSGGLALESPFATSATQRLVRVSSGGIVQGAIAALAACKNLRPISTPADPTAIAAAEAKGARAVKQAAIDEALLHGG